MNLPSSASTPHIMIIFGWNWSDRRYYLEDHGLDPPIEFSAESPDLYKVNETINYI